MPIFQPSEPESDGLFHFNGKTFEDRNLMNQEAIRLDEQFWGRESQELAAEMRKDSENALKFSSYELNKTLERDK